MRERCWWIGAGVVAAVGLASCAAQLPRLVAPINGVELPLRETGHDYSIVLAGHLFGAQGDSVEPSSSVLGNLDLFNREEVAFVLLLGDMLRQMGPAHVTAFEDSFARRVTKPVFNAIGNHDQDDAGRYRARYGDSAFSFRYASELFLFLDGERDDGDIRGEQLRFVQSELERVRRSPEVRNVFILCHRLVWAIGHPLLKGVLPYVNGPEQHPEAATGFVESVLPLLRGLERPIYLVSGDVGAPWSLPLLYERDPDADITYIATGVGDTIDDAVLLARVADGAVWFTAVSLGEHDQLGGADRLPIEAYDVAFWLRHFAARGQ